MAWQKTKRGTEPAHIKTATMPPARALKELEAAGFIVKTERGH